MEESCSSLNKNETYLVAFGNFTIVSNICDRVTSTEYLYEYSYFRPVQDGGRVLRTRNTCKIMNYLCIYEGPKNYKIRSSGLKRKKGRTKLWIILDRVFNINFSRGESTHF